MKKRMAFLAFLCLVAMTALGQTASACAAINASASHDQSSQLPAAR